MPRAIRFGIGCLLLLGTQAQAAEFALEYYVEKVEVDTSASGEEKVRYVEAQTVLPGDELRYSISLTDISRQVLDAEKIVITNPIPSNTVYVPGSATGLDADIMLSTDGGEQFVAEGEVERSADSARVTTVRWEFSPTRDLDEEDKVQFNVRIKSPARNTQAGHTQVK